MDFKQYQYLKQNLFAFDEQDNLVNRHKDIKPQNLNPLVLAYVGDAYQHLYVRTRLLDFEQAKVRLLNDVSMNFVSATWQVISYEAIKDELTDDEAYIFKRAKNAKSHAPRVASVHDYHISTGFEAVLGYLYLNKNMDRLNYLCEQAFIAAAKKQKSMHK